MPAHPLDAILANGVAVNKASTKSEVKKYSRDWGLAANFRTYDLPDTTIAVINGYLFIYDPADLTTADNGVSCVHDASARRFKRQASEVTGPGSSTDNAIPRFDGTSGAVLQGSGVTISDTNVLTVPALVDLSGAAAGQIKFPATQNASADPNVLDDYEEGNFTPTMTFNNSAAGVTYVANFAQYVKIGRLVFFYIRMVLSNNGTGVGTARIIGLPFTSAGDWSQAKIRIEAGASAGAGMYGAIDPSATTMILRIPGATADTIATDTNVTDSFDSFVTGHYTV